MSLVQSDILPIPVVGYRAGVGHSRLLLPHCGRAVAGSDRSYSLISFAIDGSARFFVFIQEGDGVNSPQQYDLR